MTDIIERLSEPRRNGEVASHDRGILYRLKSDFSLAYWRGALEAAFRECEQIERALGLPPEVHTMIYARLKQWIAYLICWKRRATMLDPTTERLQELRRIAVAATTMPWEVLKVENEKLREARYVRGTNRVAGEGVEQNPRKRSATQEVAEKYVGYVLDNDLRKEARSVLVLVGSRYAKPKQTD